MKFTSFINTENEKQTNDPNCYFSNPINLRRGEASRTCDTIIPALRQKHATTK